MNHYYSFKIFPQFWLAKHTCIIHHNNLYNPLLMTKFGRILSLMRKWHQKCSPRQVNALLTEKTWGRGWVVLVVKAKMVDTSLISRVRTTAGTRRDNIAKTARRQTRDLLFGEYLWTWTNLNVHYRRWT